MPDDAGEITRLLRDWREGDSAAENQLFALVHADLQRLAHHRMQREHPGHLLETADLVNQIYIRLVAVKDRDWQSRQHFFAIAGRAMRRYLIDLARARPKGEFFELGDWENLLPASSQKIDFAIGVGNLLDELEKVNPEWCRLIEMKFFLGLTDDEAADVLGLKLRTMQRMWHEARRWMFERWEHAHGEQV